MMSVSYTHLDVYKRQVYQLSMQYGCSEMMAMFLGSIAFSLYSEILARICKTPVTTFIICALIPLVPGGGMYRMMLQAIQGHVDESLNIGLDTISIAGVLGLRILMVSTIMRSVFKTKRQVKRSENSVSYTHLDVYKRQHRKKS